jgi:hypothetical protein
VSPTVSLGYLTPGDERVTEGPWTVIAGGTAQQHITALPEWDYSVDLRVQVELDIDLSGVLADCSLGASTDLLGIVCWTSSATRLRGAGGRSVIRQGRNIFSIDIPGERLGGELQLEARIVLGPTIEAYGELAPQKVGNTLWSITRRVTLEGSGARFPTLPVSFAATGFAGGRPALWCLLAETEDLNAAASSSLRLMLNTDHEAVLELVQQGPTDQGRQFMEFMRFDVARQLVLAALEHEELDIVAKYEPGSVGEVLAGLVNKLFPHRPVAQLRADAKTSRGDLEAEIQAQVGLLA